MPLELIDKQDNAEVIRDQIAAIIALEQAAQQAAATAAGKDPALWALQVYTERVRPWEKWLNTQADKTPIVSVWWESDAFEAGSSNVVARQVSNGIFNIDCYGYGEATGTAGGGHTPGDLDAATNAQRAVRLCRNIIMAGEYTYLGLRGIVGRRWSEARQYFQPDTRSAPALNVMGSRLRLGVKFNETSPQVTGETLETIGIEYKRASDGQVIVEAEYNYPVGGP
jgi:hypothetical protein